MSIEYKEEIRESFGYLRAGLSGLFSTVKNVMLGTPVEEEVTPDFAEPRRSDAVVDAMSIVESEREYEDDLCSDEDIGDSADDIMDYKPDTEQGEPGIEYEGSGDFSLDSLVSPVPSPVLSQVLETYGRSNDSESSL